MHSCSTWSSAWLKHSAVCRTPASTAGNIAICARQSVDAWPAAGSRLLRCMMQPEVLFVLDVKTPVGSKRCSLQRESETTSGKAAEDKLIQTPLPEELP